jgi:carbamoyl-phosphate synthase small subunit
MKPGWLYLEDGWSAAGFVHAAEGVFTAEVIFHTALTGYPELLTDPSFHGQFLVFTNPHIGNYGTDSLEWQYPRPTIQGLVVRHLSSFFSRSGKALGLIEYLRMYQVPALEGIDTRALVRRIRTKGAQKALLTTERFSMEEASERLSQAPSMEGRELASAVTTTQPYFLGEPGALRVAVLDFGVKKAILDHLVARGAYVGVFPAQASVEEIVAFEPEGFLLSNGPGDPAAMAYAIQTVSELLSLGKPMLGICLGHQLLSLALGVPTYKLLYGHHGSNHPVKDLRTGRSAITSQNHGFAISAETLEKHPDLVLTHVNLNDQTVEGFMHKTLPILGVQYHPEASPGPHDSHYIFDEFIEAVKMRRPKTLLA